MVHKTYILVTVRELLANLRRIASQNIYFPCSNLARLVQGKRDITEKGLYYKLLADDSWRR